MEYLNDFKGPLCCSNAHKLQQTAVVTHLTATSTLEKGLDGNAKGVTPARLKIAMVRRKCILTMKAPFGSGKIAF